MIEAPLWVQWIVYLAAVLSALAVIWKKAVQPAAYRYRKAHELVETIADALPTWVEVAKEFKPNGDSLPKAIYRLAEVAESAKSVAETASTVAAQAVEMNVKQQEAFERFEKYAHDRNHELANTLTKLLLQAQISDQVMRRMEGKDADVAKDLAASRTKADEVPEEAEAGKAADAASKSVE